MQCPPLETICECGHNFAVKPKFSIDATRKSKRIAMRYKRALEDPSNTMSRQELNRFYMSTRRAFESPSETVWLDVSKTHGQRRRSGWSGFGRTTFFASLIIHKMRGVSLGLICFLEITAICFSLSR